jgi:diketogulonate reductase-like aldo/keto reductase
LRLTVAVLLAWLLHQPQVTSVIVGAKRSEQLADNLAATQVSLSAAELQKINDASSLAAEYPGWMLDRQGEYRRNQVAAALAPRSGVPS